MRVERREAALGSVGLQKEEEEEDVKEEVKEGERRRRRGECAGVWHVGYSRCGVGVRGQVFM